MFPAWSLWTFPFSHRFPASPLTSHTVSVLPTIRQSSARTPWKRGANAVEARSERQERRANAVKTSCKLHGTPHRTP